MYVSTVLCNDSLTKDKGLLILGADYGVRLICESCPGDAMGEMEPWKVCLPSWQL